MKTKIRRTPHQTFCLLSKHNNIVDFLLEFRSYLQKHLTLAKNTYGKPYYTCGHDHQYPGPDWQPWKNFEQFCFGKNLDDYVALEMLEELLMRRLVCECELLTDQAEIRREELKRAFGVDFQSQIVSLAD